MRIQWNGKTQPLAFVFDFIGDNDPSDILFPAYRNYEEENPGKIAQLTKIYVNDSNAWNDNKVTLSEQEIQTLTALIDCVNYWHVQEEEYFFSAMVAPELVKERLNNWDLQDKAGLKEFTAAVDWWSEVKNIEYLIADMQDRISYQLGDDSYLFKKFCSGDWSELLDSIFTLFYSCGPYDYESLGYVDEDGEIDIPEKELEGIDRFLASNVLLLDLKDASVRYHRNNN